jgi:hypothetical protein
MMGATSHLAVVGWLAALAAALSPAVPLPELPEERLARLRPAPRAIATPPPRAPSRASASVPVRSDYERGETLLDASGSFPVLSARYDGLASFRTYSSAMVERGARFVVVRRREILAEIDIESCAIREGSPRSAFSPRARDYSGEPGLARAERLARARFGGDAKVMMLVPRALDAGLFGGIARAMEHRGDAHANYRELEGRYEHGADGVLRLHVESGTRRDGSQHAFGLVFDLDAITGPGRSA